MIPRKKSFKAGVRNVTFSTTWIIGKICQKSSHSSMYIPPIGRSLPVKTLRVRSKASNARLFVMHGCFVHYSCLTLTSCIFLLSAVPFMMLHMGISIACKWNFKCTMQCTASMQLTMMQLFCKMQWPMLSYLLTKALLK